MTAKQNNQHTSAPWSRANRLQQRRDAALAREQSSSERSNEEQMDLISTRPGNSLKEMARLVGSGPKADYNRKENTMGLEGIENLAGDGAAVDTPDQTAEGHPSPAGWGPDGPLETQPADTEEARATVAAEVAEAQEKQDQDEREQQVEQQEQGESSEEAGEAQPEQPKPVENDDDGA